jgi:glyceraldehyde 3-phosphate dehydrogenase
MVTRVAIDGGGQMARDAHTAARNHPAFAAGGRLELVELPAQDGASSCTADHPGTTPAWGEHGIDIVLECAGGDPRRHLAAGAGKVLYGAPAGGFEFDGTVVFGVNHMRLDASHRLLHAACSATHCLAPVARLLHYALGIEHGVITPMHDARHCPGASCASEHHVAWQLRQVLPGLPETLDETDPVHLPESDLRLLGMVFAAHRETSVEEVNALIQCSSFGAYGDLLLYSEGPDDRPPPGVGAHSSLFQATLTQVSGHVVKVCAGYRDELGYAHRLIDTLEVMARV